MVYKLDVIINENKNIKSHWNFYKKILKYISYEPDIYEINKEQLKQFEKIFQSFDKIRVYTKEPGKEKSPKPIIMKPNSTVEDVAEKILHGFSTKVKKTKIWGPSSKFPGQQIGLKHKLKDLDIIEFKTK